MPAPYECQACRKRVNSRTHELCYQCLVVRVDYYKEGGRDCTRCKAVGATLPNKQICQACLDEEMRRTEDYERNLLCTRCWEAPPFIKGARICLGCYSSQKERAG